MNHEKKFKSMIIISFSKLSKSFLFDSVILFKSKSLSKIVKLLKRRNHKSFLTVRLPVKHR
jgi:hypothetical protein